MKAATDKISTRGVNAQNESRAAKFIIIIVSYCSGKSYTKTINNTNNLKTLYKQISGKGPCTSGDGSCSRRRNMSEIGLWVEKLFRHANECFT
jgi:hypothetical protein